MDRKKPVSNRPRYIKPYAIRQFEGEYTRWYYTTQHPSIPETHWVRQDFRDDTAPHLEKLIQAYGRMHGWCLSKISTTGVFRDSRKQVTDCIGNTHVIGSAKWTPGGATVGVADIVGSIGGRYVEIEVKIGKDRQRDAQRQHEQTVNASGGSYIIVHTFEDFTQKINQWLKSE